MQSHDDIGWRRSGSALLLSAEWDGHYILFHPPSGDTHYVNDLGALVLDILSDEPVSEADLCAELAEVTGQPPSDKFCRQVASLLARYDQLGLVERDRTALHEQ